MTVRLAEGAKNDWAPVARQRNVRAALWICIVSYGCLFACLIYCAEIVNFISNTKSVRRHDSSCQLCMDNNAQPKRERHSRFLTTTHNAWVKYIMYCYLYSWYPGTSPISYWYMCKEYQIPRYINQARLTSVSCRLYLYIYTWSTNVSIPGTMYRVRWYLHEMRNGIECSSATRSRVT